MMTKLILKYDKLYNDPVLSIIDGFHETYEFMKSNVTLM